MKISEITAKIEQFANPSLQEDFDNTGLQVGDPDQEATGVMISLDATEDVVDEAIEHNCNLIVTHHPLLFRGLKKITNSDMTGRIVMKAIKHGIVIYAAHTNLDKCRGGINYRMAEMLGLEQIEVLNPEKNDPEEGLGCIGTLSQPTEETKILSKIKEIFRAKSIRHTALLGKKVSRIAVCGGSGSDYINRAKELKADLYITADITYHKFFEADNQIVIADIGHFECESATKLIFKEQISKIFPKFAVRISQREQNVVHYS